MGSERVSGMEIVPATPAVDTAPLLSPGPPKPLMLPALKDGPAPELEEPACPTLPPPKEAREECETAVTPGIPSATGRRSVGTLVEGSDP